MIAGLWTFGVHAVWGWIALHMFKGRYLGDAWMIWLWGACAALSFGQVVVNTALQVVKAFKALALANAAASVVAAGAILWIAHVWGLGGSVVGTAVGQAFELVVMTYVLARVLSGLRRISP